MDKKRGKRSSDLDSEKLFENFNASTTFTRSNFIYPVIFKLRYSDILILKIDIVFDFI